MEGKGIVPSPVRGKMSMTFEELKKEYGNFTFEDRNKIAQEFYYAGQKGMLDEVIEFLKYQDDLDLSMIGDNQCLRNRLRKRYGSSAK